MSTISIVVPVEMLANESVARALTHLTLALGGHEEGQSAGPPQAPTPPVDVLAYAEMAAEPLDIALRSRWDAYVASLAEPARRFLALLEKWGRLTITEAVEMLGLSGGKAVSGITGPLGRWTPKHGFAVPYETHEDAHGVRYWIWKGVAPA